MLSALAKYIFGGVMGDAPETTSMQYETREMNDWLLVDMPDQDIDNEDMDSESDDDDDILTAVPLLLAEEVSESPRQIVLSYEPDSSCDKSYSKIRKGFQDKIHSASSKVQAHTGDKIQGNFVANVEAISLETDTIPTDKVQCNLYEGKEDIKSKKSKSKNLKPKKSKKNKINKKCIAKTQDTSAIIKNKCSEGVQEKPNDNELLNLKGEIQFVSNKTPRNLGSENHSKLSDKGEEYHTEIINNSNQKGANNVRENTHIAITENSNQTIIDNNAKDFQIIDTNNSSHKNIDNDEKDIQITDKSSHGNADQKEENNHTSIRNNSSHKNESKVETNVGIAVKDNFRHKKARKVEKNSDIVIVDSVEKESFVIIADNSSHRNISNHFSENHASKVQENVINQTLQSSNENILSSSAIIESNLSNISKRSYADVVKAKSNASDKDCNKEVTIDEICETELDCPKISHHEKIQDYQQELNDSNRPKDKKNKSKKLSKNKVQNEANIKCQNIHVSDTASYQNEAQENINNKTEFSDKTEIISPEVQESFNDETENNCKEKNVSDRNSEKCNIKKQTICLTAYENFTEVLEDINDKNRSLQVQEKCKIIQDNFTGKSGVVGSNVSEGDESRLQDTCNAQNTENISFENLECNNVDFQDEAIHQEDFIDDIYFDLLHNENIIFTDNCHDLSKINHQDNDYHQEKTQDSFEFTENLDDKVLENIADLWDIYTKIQDISDDEISDDEMNENFNECLQKISDREMNENSDEQITDDEMNENSHDEYEEISDDEVHGRSCSKILQNLFREESTKLYNRAFEYNADEESEESDSESLINHLMLPSIKSKFERKSEFLQPFKCDFLAELKQNMSEIPKHHSSCIPLAEYELVEYFNFEPQYFHACQSLQYPSSYALAIAEYYSNNDQYFPKYTERCNTFLQKYKRTATEDEMPSAKSETALITNTAEILEKIINQKCSVLPTKTAVVLEHVKDLKPVQQAIQYEARKYLTRSQLNRQNRNYIYQSSTKTNRRRNLQRNHSGVNNNRKCC